MVLTTLHCDGSGTRVATAACYEAYLAGNCGARLTQYQRRALEPCKGCARGRRNRARWSAEGFRMGSADASAWREELARWARVHPEMFEEREDKL